MPEYKCQRCGKVFKQKGHYTSHMNRKKPCKNINKIIEDKVNKNLKKMLKNNVIQMSENMDIKTFNELYDFFQIYDSKDIIEWLNVSDKSEAGYRQEATLKLLGSLGTIDKLQDYLPCTGNFNKKTIEQFKSYRDIFYEQNKEIDIRGNSGDSSDFTLIHKENDKHILVISSKNLNKEKSGSIDIEKMSFYAKEYNDTGININYGFCVPDKKKTDEMMERCNSSSDALVDIYKKSIIIDKGDLYEALCKFKSSYQNISLDNILNQHKKPLCLKMHQKFGVQKTILLKKDSKDKILWGHIQRSGKSYIIGGSIIEDSYDKTTCNYLVITTAPNETIEQQSSVFDCNQLMGFNIIILNVSITKA